ncbi:MAG: hypothetical protein WAN14_16550 [Candidatus Acidiferrales bacterium]
MKRRYLFGLLMLLLPSVANAQSVQTYCNTESGHTVCNSYNSDGSLKQTYCQDGYGTTVNCNSYSSDGLSAQTQCHNGFANSVNCNTYNSDGTSKQTECHDSFGHTTDCTSYHSDGSMTQTSCHDTFGQTVSCTSTTSGSATSQTIVTTAPTPPAGPTCDANCQNANYYAAGQAVGSALGVVVGGAIEAHRKHKFCKSHPGGSWKYSDGSVSACASINARQETRQIPVAPDVRAQLQSQADQAHQLMEGLRKDISDLQLNYTDAPGAQSALQQSRSSWLDMKNIYCGYYRGASYTGLDGTLQICQ